MRAFERFSLATGLAALLLGAPTATADIDDLSGGVFIVHAPAGLEYSTDPPTEGWCDLYSAQPGIGCCENQHPRIEVQQLSIWFVLSAWMEDKRFYGVQFGLGDYDAGQFLIAAHGPCEPEGGVLQISTPNWPGPNEGIAFVAIGGNYWFGNFVPVYYFAAYADAPGLVPLGPDPSAYPGPFGGWANPDLDYPTDCFGALGLGVDGVECCPESSPSPAEPSTWGLIKALYR